MKTLGMTVRPLKESIPMCSRAEWDEWLDSDPAYREWSETVELENRQEDERNRKSTETD